MADEPGQPPPSNLARASRHRQHVRGALVCFAIAAGLIAGYVVVRQRNIVDLQDPVRGRRRGRQVAAAPRPTTAAAPTHRRRTADVDGDLGQSTSAAEPATTAATSTAPPATRRPRPRAPTATFPDADPEAQNFLITGADNGACIDPDSPYAGAFGDREGMGERSDTIMVLRVDPDADRVAVLSFPRDLYVDIAGSGSKSRINSAYRRDDPQRLIDTIFENFGIPIDHYIQVDFCAFKTLVDAVGGVAVPFEFPARDENTGLNVPTTGCFVFDGEHALAYVRSRHYEYEDPPGSGELERGSVERPRSCVHDSRTSSAGRCRASSTRDHSTRGSPAASSAPRPNTSSPTVTSRRRACSSSPE